MSSLHETERIMLGTTRLEVSYAQRLVPCTANCDQCGAEMKSHRTEFDIQNVVVLPDRKHFSVGADLDYIRRAVRANVMIRGGMLTGVACLCEDCDRRRDAG